MTGLWLIAFLMLWVLVIALAFVVLGTLRRLERELEIGGTTAGELIPPGGPPLGSPVPPFSARAVDGRVVSERDLGERACVLFLGWDCQPCAELLRDLVDRTAPMVGADLFVAVDVIHGKPAFREQSWLTTLVNDGSLARAFESNATPHAFVVDVGIVRASGTPNTWEALRRLIHEGAGSHAQADLEVIQAVW